MAELFFCNIGWMSRYEGLKGKPDKIVGGGKWVDEYAKGNEVCNFLPADDGFVYGHVETIKKDIDRSISLKPLGASGAQVSGIDVVWTATHPDESGRRVVGWYRNATIYSQRQKFSGQASKQHARDDLKTYRIRARAKDVQLLDLDKRMLALGKGCGWMGHTPWWTPPKGPSSKIPDEQFAEIRKFLANVRKLLDGRESTTGRTSSKSLVDQVLEGIAHEITVIARSRSGKLRKAAIQRAQGICETCGNDFNLVFNGAGLRALQVHHKLQLALQDVPKLTTPDDLAVVCANCHAIIHANLKNALPVDVLRTWWAEHSCAG